MVSQPRSQSEHSQLSELQISQTFVSHSNSDLGLFPPGTRQCPLHAWPDIPFKKSQWQKHWMTPKFPGALLLIQKYLSLLSHLLTAARRATACPASCHFPWCIALVMQSICSQKTHAWEIGSCGNLSLAFTNTWVARWYSPWNKGLTLYKTDQLHGPWKANRFLS